MLENSRVSLVDCLAAFPTSICVGIISCLYSDGHTSTSNKVFTFGKALLRLYFSPDTKKRGKEGLRLSGIPSPLYIIFPCLRLWWHTRDPLSRIRHVTKQKWGWHPIIPSHYITPLTRQQNLPGDELEFFRPHNPPNKNKKYCSKRSPHLFKYICL